AGPHPGRGREADLRQPLHARARGRRRALDSVSSVTRSPLDMILGRVIGTVWATRKDEQTVGMTFQLVREVELDYSPKSGFVVAVDSVGAGVGEIVLVAQGSSGRQTELTRNKPVDAVIMAIVDRLAVDEAEVAEAKRRVALPGA